MQYYALDALFNSLEFCHQNFQNEAERNIIMQTVCEATQNAADKVQIKAFECLVEAMHLYYDQMKYYMEQALYVLTTNGMRSGSENVVLQAIEFWSTVCEEEADINDENFAARNADLPPERVNYDFAKTALPQILPDLLELLKQQDEDAGDDDWNPAMASGTCLSLLAKTVGDAIIPQVVAFIERHVTSTEWRHREAAVMAFGTAAQKRLCGELLPALKMDPQARSWTGRIPRTWRR